MNDTQLKALPIILGGLLIGVIVLSLLLKAKGDVEITKDHWKAL